MRNVCRRGALWALFMILLLSPVSSDAGFLVEFRNGRSVRVKSYRVDGKNYELYLESGSLRVSREEIKSIQEKKDDVVRISAGETENNKSETRGNLKEQEPSKNSVNTASQETAIESTLKRRAELQERLEEAKRLYFGTTERTEKDWARQKMTSCAHELFLLEAEVMRKHNGSLPDWWKEN